MGFKYTLLAIGICTLVAVVVAQDSDYFEDEEPKPAAPPPRPSILRRPGIVPRGKTTSTTTTPPPPPKEAAPTEEDLPSDEYPEGEEEGQEEPTTTPASRKIKGGVVRPFRSNVDLLAALKRRRAEAANGKGHHSEVSNSPPADSATESHSAPVKNNQVGRKVFNQRTKSEPTQASVEEATTAASKNSRTRNRFNGRGLYKSPSNENSEIASLETNQQSVEVKPRGSFKPGQRRF